jgi:hypothetical protein
LSDGKKCLVAGFIEDGKNCSNDEVLLKQKLDRERIDTKALDNKGEMYSLEGR